MLPGMPSRGQIGPVCLAPETLDILRFLTTVSYHPNPTLDHLEVYMAG